VTIDAHVHLWDRRLDPQDWIDPETMAPIARDFGAADLVAMLAILTALAVGNPLPGHIVVLMQTGGEALEEYAQGRASQAVRELEAAAPRIAHRERDGEVEDIPAEEVVPGDVLLLRPGELLPSDGVVVSGQDRATERWALWLVAPDGSTRALAESGDRLNRPIVQPEGTVLFGQQRVEAAIHLWAR